MAKTKFNIGDWVRFEGNSSKFYRIADMDEKNYILNSGARIGFDDADLIPAKAGRTNASLMDVKRSLIGFCYTGVEEARKHLGKTCRFKYEVTGYMSEMMRMCASTRKEAENEAIRVLQEMIEDIKTGNIYQR